MTIERTTAGLPPCLSPLMKFQLQWWGKFNELPPRPPYPEQIPAWESQCCNLFQRRRQQLSTEAGQADVAGLDMSRAFAITAIESIDSALSSMIGNCQRALWEKAKSDLAHFLSVTNAPELAFMDSGRTDLWHEIRQESIQPTSGHYDGQLARQEQYDQRMQLLHQFDEIVRMTYETVGEMTAAVDRAKEILLQINNVPFAPKQHISQDGGDPFRGYNLRQMNEAKELQAQGYSNERIRQLVA